jgi:proline racemase
VGAHGIIVVTKNAIETGLIPRDQTMIQIDAPAGRIVAYATIDQTTGLVSQVAFDNVPSFVIALDQVIHVEGIGVIRYDLAFDGGAYYAYVDVDVTQQFHFDFGLEPKNVNQLIDAIMRIKRAIMKEVELVHPEHADLSFLYGTIFVGKAKDPIHHSRNVCIFAKGKVDRSPTGTGMSGRAAIHVAQGELDMGQTISIESILGTILSVTPVQPASMGKHLGIVPRVLGTAPILGKHEFVVDPNDPLRDGFVFR